MSYTHFTLEEREYLQQKRREKWSIRKIAYSMNRSPSSISREIKRNSETDGRYRPFRADAHARTRRKNSRKARLIPGSPEWIYVIDKLTLFWSPEAISGRWSLDNPTLAPISYSTIYRYINKGALPNISRKTHLRRHGNKKRIKKGLYVTIKPDRIIPQWPKTITTRSRYGDWEGDTVYGAKGKGCIVTLVERKSKVFAAARSANREAENVRKAFVHAFQLLGLSLPIETITLDNGSEFAKFRDIETDLDTKIYFADPHAPWQRGLNENTNDMIRFFFPKGTDFHKVTDEELQAVVSLINNRPRKTLGFLSPLEFISKKCCT